MQFKHNYLQDELLKANSLLRQMLVQFELKSMEYGVEPVITRIYGDSGVHAFGRAADLRSHHAGRQLYTDEQADELVAFMNDRFPRFDGKPTCWHHSADGKPFHFHIQVAGDWAAYKRGEKDNG